MSGQAVADTLGGPDLPTWLRFKGGRVFHLLDHTRQTSKRFIVGATLCRSSGDFISELVYRDDLTGARLCETCQERARQR